MGTKFHINSMNFLLGISSVAPDFHYRGTSSFVHVPHDLDFVWYVRLPSAASFPTLSNLLDNQLLKYR